MKTPDDQHKKYFFLQGDELKCKDNLDEKDFFMSDYSDFILIPISIVSQSYFKVDKKDSQIKISDIDKLINNIKNLESESILAAITCLNDHIQILKKELNQDLEITIETINSIFYLNNIKNDQYQNDVEKLQTMINDINALTTIIKKITIFTQAFKILQKTIFNLICDIANLINKLNQNQLMSQHLLNSFLYDGQKTIAVFIEDFTNETNHTNENIEKFKQIYNDIIDQSQQEISKIIGNSTDNIHQYFQNEVLAFKKKLMAQKDNFQIDKLLPELKKLSTDFGNLSDKLLSEYYFILLHLFNVGKGVYKQQSNILFNNIRNIGVSRISRLYNRLRFILFNNNSKSYLKLLRDIIIEIFELIYQQDKESCINLLKEIFANKKPQDNRFNDGCTFYNILIDSDLNIVLQKTYSDDDKNQFEKEIEFLTKTSSTFIVHYSKDPNHPEDSKIHYSYLPYYSNGTLYSYLFYQFHLTLQDKISFISEIAQAIIDLHSKNEYHGNLSDQHIFISHNKNAFLGSIYYNDKQKDMDTKSKFQIFFRNPEYFLTEQDKTTKDYQSADIFSFGVLMYEILTETLPESIFKNMSNNDRKEILKGNYKDFLFKKENDEFFKNNPDLKNIISKCMDVNKNNRYQSIEDALKDFKNTNFYKKYSNDIEFRISQVNDNNENSKFNLIDIFEGYFTQKKDYHDDIERFFSFFIDSCASCRTIIGKIISFSCPNSNYLVEEEEIFDLLKILSSFYPQLKYLTKSIDEKIFDIIDELQKNREIYYIDSYFNIFLDILIDCPEISQNNNELFIQEANNQFTDANSTYEIFSNGTEFLLRKKYNDYENLKDQISKEISTLQTENTEFITPIKKNKQEIILPYFPFGSLYDFLNNSNQIELSNAIKIKMILSIATAINSLHSQDKTLGYLFDQSIFITSQMNAYIGANYYNESANNNNSTLPRQFYFRAPSCYFKNSKSADIYSFGVIAFEILTGKRPEILMKEKTREEKHSILNSTEYCNFLLSKVTLDNELKKFIHNCMKIDENNNEQFKSFEKIIAEIKSLEIFRENQNIIELLFKQETECKTNYNCNYIDIIESIFRGNKNGFNIIQKYFKDKKKTIHTIDDLFISNKKLKESAFNSDFELFFSFLMRKYQNIKINENNTVNLDDRLLCLSYIANYNKKLPNIDEFKMICSENPAFSNSDYYITPICTLGDILKKDKHMLIPYSLSWPYMIAREMNQIHSLELFVGDLSVNKIGIYFDTKTNRFVPSIILYYIIDQKIKSKQKKEKCKSYCCCCCYNCSQNKSFNDWIEKDFKHFISIVEDNFITFQSDFLENIGSFNAFITHLYNYVLDNSNKINCYTEEILNQKEFDYSTLNLTYNSLNILISKYSNLLETSFFIDTELILNKLLQLISNPTKSINEIWPLNQEIVRSFNIDKIDELNEKIFKEWISISNVIDENKCNKVLIPVDSVEQQQQNEPKIQRKFEFIPLNLQKHIELRQLEKREEELIFAPYNDPYVAYLSYENMVFELPNMLNRSKLRKDKRFHIIINFNFKNPKEIIERIFEKLPKRVARIFVDYDNRINLLLDKEN